MRHPSDQTGGTNGARAPDRAGKSLFSMALWGPDGPPGRVVTRDYRCPGDPGHDDQCRGHFAPIRKPAAIPPPNIILTREDMQAVAMGYRPVDMNDKWLAFMEGNRLYLHRSRTGHGIYEVTFAAKETGFVATSARVESDGDRWKKRIDPNRERDLLRRLIVHVAGDPMPPLLPVIVSRKPAIEVVLGDITTQHVDAVVNAANTGLHIGSGGVNGAVHRAAGPELSAHCSALGGCPVGRARITPGYRLAARWVIHTVGPTWRGGEHGEPVLLESCHRESLARADEVGPTAWPSRHCPQAPSAIPSEPPPKPRWTRSAPPRPRSARFASSASTAGHSGHSFPPSATTADCLPLGLIAR